MDTDIEAVCVRLKGTQYVFLTYASQMYLLIVERLHFHVQGLDQLQCVPSQVDSCEVLEDVRTQKQPAVGRGFVSLYCIRFHSLPPLPLSLPPFL